MDIVEPHLPYVVPLFRALHTYHAELSPGLYHCDGPDGAYLRILEDVCSNGGRVFAHDAGWGLVSYVLAMPSMSPRGALKCAKRQVIVEHLYVAPVARGLGLGTDLIDRVELWCRELGADGWHVTHHVANSAAGRFYQAAGALPVLSVSAKYL